MEDIVLMAQKTKDLNLLYVEDNEIIRMSNISFYENFFNDIFVATDGKEGIELFEENEDEIDLIITDLSMPVMGGLEMIKEIRKKNKTVHIFIVSAYNDDEIVDDIKTLNIISALRKPVDQKQFVENISKIL